MPSGLGGCLRLAMVPWFPSAGWHLWHLESVKECHDRPNLFSASTRRYMQKQTNHKEWTVEVEAWRAARARKVAKVVERERVLMRMRTRTGAKESTWPVRQRSGQELRLWLEARLQWERERTRLAGEQARLEQEQARLEKEQTTLAWGLESLKSLIYLDFVQGKHQLWQGMNLGSKLLETKMTLAETMKTLAETKKTLTEMLVKRSKTLAKMLEVT